MLAGGSGGWFDIWLLGSVVVIEKKKKHRLSIILSQPIRNHISYIIIIY